MSSLPAPTMDLESLRRSVRSLEAEQMKLAAANEELDRGIARLSGAARNMGYSGTLPEPASPRSNRGVILLYHRIAVVDPDPARLCTAPAIFRMHMEHIARTCEPLSLDALADRVAKNEIPRSSVAITFDDGYLDAFTASDILSSLHLPATFFLNSNSGGETFLDLLARIFLTPAAIPPALDISVAGATLRYRCENGGERHAVFDALREMGWALSGDGRRELVAALRRWSGLDLAPRTTHRLLTPSETRELADRLDHSIGSHSDNHLVLSAQPQPARIREIAANRRFLQDVTGRPVTAFAYPYGIYDTETVHICRRLAFKTAVTVDKRPVRPWNDPMLLPRLEVKADSIEELESLLNLG